MNYQSLIPGLINSSKTTFLAVNSGRTFVYTHLSLIFYRPDDLFHGFESNMTLTMPCFIQKLTMALSSFLANIQKWSEIDIFRPNYPLMWSF